jgi:hypothetical protein
LGNYRNIQPTSAKHEIRYLEADNEFSAYKEGEHLYPLITKFKTASETFSANYLEVYKPEKAEEYTCGGCIAAGAEWIINDKYKWGKTFVRSLKTIHSGTCCIDKRYGASSCNLPMGKLSGD